jgi:hypothetical protein
MKKIILSLIKMSSKVYSIKRWDGIITHKSEPLPAISFLPDLNLLDQLEKNTNNLIQIRITGTGSGYDNVWMGIIDSSFSDKGCRKNFYDTCHLWVITLLQDPSGNSAYWNGPPSSFGSFQIVDGAYQTYKSSCDQPKLAPEIHQEPTLVGQSLGKVKKPVKENFEINKDNRNMIVFVAFILVIIGIILLFCGMKKK